MTERVPIWAAALLGVSVVAFLTLLVGGPAIGWFARQVQFVLGLIGLLALVGGAIALWLGRHDGHAKRRDAQP